jgi:MerR family mercuric resistance operon transcriptional regulator
MTQTDMTIGDVAEAAGVGVETVRYYERRGLISQPVRAVGGYRRYGGGHVHRIHFIKRAQDLGFTLEEIESLLELEDGTDRRSIRRIAAKRLDETRRRIADLQRIERALGHLLHECEEHVRSPRCPIIAAIASGNGDTTASGGRERSH